MQKLISRSLRAYWLGPKIAGKFGFMINAVSFVCLFVCWSCHSTRGDGENEILARLLLRFHMGCLKLSPGFFGVRVY